MQETDNQPDDHVPPEPAPDAGSAASPVAGDDLSAAYASPPPRAVQPILALITVCGNSLLRFAILWMGIISVLARIAFPACDRLALVSCFSPVETAPGVVTGLWDSSLGDSSSGTAIKKYYYTYPDRNGTSHDAWQFSNGGTYTDGANVSVEYSRRFPGVSRIAGLEPAAPLVVVIVISVFILIGVLFVVGGLKRGVRALSILRDGETAVGVLQSKTLKQDKDGSNSKGRADYWWDMVYQFKAKDGSEHQVWTSEYAGRAHEDNPEAEVESDTPTPPRLFLMYSVSSPDNAITTDQLPGHPRFDRTGTVYSGSPLMLVAYLIVPGLFLLIHGLWWYAARI